ncbi:hypothetical protein [Streptomyces sp. SBT349]|uniref:DUF7848 domain-containing protein n=1 Tax=Streptomyces sp. SBT349 TaxID=1580539 RepID=UPI0007C7D547|nr:hypothetical protein [Streptomyces sp. SBT349]
MSETPVSVVRLAAVERQSGRTFRFREYTIVPDTEPDAEPWIFSFECVVCEEEGPENASQEEALSWTLVHLKAYPEHLSFRERITRPYRAVPGRWQ